MIDWITELKPKEMMKTNDEDLEEYREMLQDVFALRCDLRLFYTPDKELSDAIYDIEEPLDALFKALKRVVLEEGKPND